MVVFEEIDSYDGPLQGPKAFLVTGAGWPKANGIYVPVNGLHMEGAFIYENAHSFLLSRECHQTKSGKEMLGWILGIGQKPLYAMQTEQVPPPYEGWKSVVAGCGSSLVVEDCDGALEAATRLSNRLKEDGDDFMAKGDWSRAEDCWAQAVDALQHLLEEEGDDIASLTQELQMRRVNLPLKKAECCKAEAERLEAQGDWDAARYSHGEALDALREMVEEPDSVGHCATLRKELQTSLKELPMRRAKHSLLNVESLAASKDWIAAEEKAVDVFTALMAETSAEANELRRRASDLQAFAARERLSALLGNAAAEFKNGNYARADEAYALALRLAEQLGGSEEEAAERVTDIEESRCKVALQAAQVLQAQGQEARDKQQWLAADNYWRQVLKVLEPCGEEAEAEALRDAAKTALRLAAEDKVKLARAGGKEAMEAGDWSKADRWYVEALRILEPYEKEAHEVLEEIRAERTKAAIEIAKPFKEEADEARNSGNLFMADEKYGQCLDILFGHDRSADAIRVPCWAARAELLQKKWQYEEAISDASNAIQHMDAANISLRKKMHMIAGRCCKDLIRKEDDGERKWGRAAVHHLKKVEELETDKSKKFEIRKMIRVWERSVPEVKVVPKVPDSTPYPKEALANYFGKVSSGIKGRHGFGDKEILDAWNRLPKEGGIRGQYVSKKNFWRVVNHLSGKMDDDEFDELWKMADPEDRGVLSFNDFERILKFEDDSENKYDENDKWKTGGFIAK